MQKKYFLLNPGPVTLTERVRNSLLQPDMCHREDEFAEMQKRIIDKLKHVYPSASKTYTPVLLTGSGTAAVEAMLQTFAKHDEKTLVVANGVYGERIANILKKQNKPYTMIQSEWQHDIDLSRVEDALKSEKYGYVASVHHETTTGRLNSIPALGKLCQKYKVPMLLDGVSSFGGEKINHDEWNIAAVAATANKCLHSVPGISFVQVRNELLENGVSYSTSVYLDLISYYTNQKSGFSPFTQSVHVLYALEEALNELKDQGGFEARHKFYLEKSSYIISTLTNAGFELFLDSKDDYSHILISFKIPAQFTYELLHETLKEEGFIIYAGQGNFSGKIFRISIMGEVQISDLDRLCKNIIKLAGK